MERSESTIPNVRADRSVSRRAKVKGCFPEHNDDVVLLKLSDGPSPLGPELAAKLGSARGSQDHDFRSFGYRRLKNYQGLPAYGKIVDFGEIPTDARLQGEPLMLCSQHIDRGMSGAPVLDIQRNLITGIIYLSWDSAGGACDRDTGFAVDARVLSLEPLGLALQYEDLPKAPAPTPKVGIPAACVGLAPKQIALWNNAPSSLEEWVGRENLLGEITSDWVNSDARITGLIGFGGEGKSSLARRWVDTLLADKSLQQPDGLFWWGFYERRNVDEFFEEALNYLSGEKIDPRKIPSASMRAQIIASMLGAGRYLFILDGLEVLQHQDGDLYGSLRSQDLKIFLEFFAAPEHNSFCLVTSRAPLLNLEEYTTYKHRDVDRLSPNDGRNLLRKLGVQGKEEDLDHVVENWDGHALTLSLLASYLQDHLGGDIGHIKDIPPPVADESHYERVHRVLRRYDEHLTSAERAFLKLFSIFRRPVDQEAFAKVFRAQAQNVGAGDALNAPIAALDGAQFQAMLKRLVAYRVLRFEPDTGQLTAHPLIRAHYNDLLASELRQTKQAHLQAKEYYLAKARNMRASPSLEELSPLIEAVHHACLHGNYDEAYGIQWNLINKRSEFYLMHQLGAWETQLEIMQEFFPKGDTSQKPLASGPRSSWILNTVGLCLAGTGQGDRAKEFHQRALRIALDSQDWANASTGYQNLSELYLLRGELDHSISSTKEAVKLARRAKSKQLVCESLSYQSWALHLQGRVGKARRTYRKVEALNINLSIKYIHSISGIQQADHKRRLGDTDYALKVTKANLKISEEYHYLSDISMCHRVLGDLCADADQRDEAAKHYRQALDISRETSMKQVLIEALLARGRWEARHRQDPEAAFSNLKEALDYAKAGGYRLYEADIRVALAWAHLAAGDRKSAREEAEYALQMSEAMGYHWGKVDANEVLAEIASREALPETRDPH